MLAAAAVAAVLVIFLMLSVIHVFFMLGIVLVLVLLGVGAFRVGRRSGRGSRRETWQ